MTGKGEWKQDAIFGQKAERLRRKAGEEGRRKPMLGADQAFRQGGQGVVPAGRPETPGTGGPEGRAGGVGRVRDPPPTNTGPGGGEESREARGTY